MHAFTPPCPRSCPQGTDEAYDAALVDFYSPYHHLVDLLLRVSVNNKHVTGDLVELSAMVAFEGAPLHMQLFPKLWYAHHPQTFIPIILQYYQS
jgi:ubiquitin carboxyl-terminal hydrolase 34